MNHENSIFFRYLEQTRNLYGNTLILGKKRHLDSECNNISLNSHNNLISKYTKCYLLKSKTSIVYGQGKLDAGIVFVQAVDKKEDFASELFSVQSGDLFDKILYAIGLKRENVFICNLVKFNSQGSRESYLNKQLGLLEPKLIVILGDIPACTILKTKDSLNVLRSKIFKYEGVDLIVTFHPDELLLNPNLKKNAWEDFKIIKNKYLSNNNYE